MCAGRCRCACTGEKLRVEVPTFWVTDTGTTLPPNEEAQRPGAVAASASSPAGLLQPAVKSAVAESR